MCKTTIGYVHTVTTAAVEVKFYGEELDLMESAACAANKSLSEFAAEAALAGAEIYLRAYAAARQTSS